MRSTKKPVIRGFGLQWVSMMRLVPVPWSRRVWALPLLTAWCWPAEQSPCRRHKTSVDGVRHLVTHVRRWQPGRSLVRGVDGGLAAGSRALAGATHQVSLVSRRRGAAARDHPPAPQPPGKRGRKPTTGPRQRRLQRWAERAATPWETVAGVWSGGQLKHLWVCSRTARWYTPRQSPIAIRDGLVADPEGQLRLEACCCTAVQATPAQILPWVVMRWSVEVTFEATRAHRGVETPRQWSEPAMARTPPVRLGLFSLVSGLALRLSGAGGSPVPQTAWSRTTAPTCADCLALVRQHLWRARSVVNSTPEAESMQFPPETLALVIQGLPFAA